MIGNSSLVDILKVENRKSIRQYIPTKFKHLTTVKKIDFNGRKLKTSKILDLTHRLLSRYFQREKRDIKLSSTILRDVYGTFYNYYIDYLIAEKFIKLKSKYYTGKKCNTYTIRQNIIDGDISCWYNTDKNLIKKHKRRALEYQLDNLNDMTLNKSVKAKLIEDLKYVHIDFPKASKEILDLYNNNEITKVAFYKNMMSIESVASGEIFFSDDQYGRLHTNFTVLKKVVRSKYITIEGKPVKELDIKNSQPTFLAVFLKECGFSETHPIEYGNFLFAVKNNLFYDQFMNKWNKYFPDKNITREIAKKKIYGVFFDKHRFDIPNKIFSSLYPQIWEWIRQYKTKHNNHAALSWELQKRESTLMFDHICSKIKREYPHIRMFTVHDSIFFPTEYAEKVETIFYNYVDCIFA